MKIVIAGASGGVGKDLSRYFDKEDNFLYLTYNRSQDNVYQPELAQVETFQCDFTNFEDAEKLYNSIESIDVLINVMGTTNNAMVKKMSSDQWSSVINTNLNTVFNSCRWAISKMAPNSHVINISSVLGVTGMMGASNYAAAKGGVEAFTRSLAQEVIRNKIFVNGIALGYFKTGMGLQLTDNIVELTLKKIPVHEFGEPEEIYKVIQFIIDSQYLVGQILHLNGGYKI